MINKCRNVTTYNQHVLHWDTLYDIKRKKYKIVCAELLFVKVTLDTQGLAPGH